MAIAAAALLGCQGSSSARASRCGQPYFVTGVVDPGYGYGGGYGGGTVVWYDPGDDWSPGDPSPPPDDGSYDNGGGDYCSQYPDDPSCGGSGYDNGGDPSSSSDNGGDPSAGSDNGGDTSGGDTTGDTSGDGSGGDGSGDVSLARRLHLKGGSHATSGGLRVQGVPSACYTCTMMCQLDDGTTARAATGGSDLSDGDACNAAVHQLELWAHHDYGRKITGCTSVDASGNVPAGASAQPHVPAAPSVAPSAPSPVPGAPVEVGQGTRDVRGQPTLTR